MRLIHFTISAVVVFCLCGVATDNVLSATGTGFLLLSHMSAASAAKIFGNMTYFLGGNKREAIKLKNGRFFKRYCWDVFYDNRYVLGDFDHDGLKDAAVIIVVNPGGGNINEFELAFLINDGTRLVHSASQHLEESAIINSLKEQNGKVVVDMFIHQKGDSHGGPSKRIRNVYEYKGPEFPAHQT